MPDSPKQNRIACVVLILYLLFLAGAASSQSYNFPPRLPSGHFLRDDANLLEMENRLTLETLQKRIYAQTKSPLVVVTIDRMSAFTSQQSEIDTFVRAWFNHWAIGSKTGNTGVLLLVSREDRQAWIELGTAWGGQWASYRDLILRGIMIPAFNKGDDAGGILAGVHALADMVVQGPQGVVPSLGIVANLMTIPLMQRVQEWQALSPRWGLLTLAFGLLSMVGSFVIRRWRGALLLGGLVLLLGGFLPILLLLLPLVIGYFMRSSRRSIGSFDHTDRIPAENYSRAQGGM